MFKNIKDWLWSSKSYRYAYLEIEHRSKQVYAHLKAPVDFFNHSTRTEQIALAIIVYWFGSVVSASRHLYKFGLAAWNSHRNKEKFSVLVVEDKVDNQEYVIKIKKGQFEKFLKDHYSDNKLDISSKHLEWKDHLENTFLYLKTRHFFLNPLKVNFVMDFLRHLNGRWESMPSWMKRPLEWMFDLERWDFSDWTELKGTSEAEMKRSLYLLENNVTDIRRMTLDQLKTPEDVEKFVMLVRLLRTDNPEPMAGDYTGYRHTKVTDLNEYLADILFVRSLNDDTLPSLTHMLTFDGSDLHLDRTRKNDPWKACMEILDSYVKGVEVLRSYVDGVRGDLVAEEFRGLANQQPRSLIPAPGNDTETRPELEPKVGDSDQSSVPKVEAVSSDSSKGVVPNLHTKTIMSNLQRVVDDGITEITEQVSGIKENIKEVHTGLSSQIAEMGDQVKEMHKDLSSQIVQTGEKIREEISSEVDTKFNQVSTKFQNQYDNLPLVKASRAIENTANKIKTVSTKVTNQVTQKTRKLDGVAENPFADATDIFLYNPKGNVSDSDDARDSTPPTTQQGDETVNVDPLQRAEQLSQDEPQGKVVPFNAGDNPKINVNPQINVLQFSPVHVPATISSLSIAGGPNGFHQARNATHEPQFSFGGLASSVYNHAVKKALHGSNVGSQPKPLHNLKTNKKVRPDQYFRDLVNDNDTVASPAQQHDDDTDYSMSSMNMRGWSRILTPTQRFNNPMADFGKTEEELFEREYERNLQEAIRRSLKKDGKNLVDINDLPSEDELLDLFGGPVTTVNDGQEEEIFLTNTLEPENDRNGESSPSPGTTKVATQAVPTGNTRTSGDTPGGPYTIFGPINPHYESSDSESEPEEGDDTTSQTDEPESDQQSSVVVQGRLSDAAHSLLSLYGGVKEAEKLPKPEKPEEARDEEEARNEENHPQEIAVPLIEVDRNLRMELKDEIEDGVLKTTLNGIFRTNSTLPSYQGKGDYVGRFVSLMLEDENFQFTLNSLLKLIETGKDPDYFAGRFLLFTVSHLHDISGSIVNNQNGLAEDVISRVYWDKSAFSSHVHDNVTEQEFLAFNMENEREHESWNQIIHLNEHLRREIFRLLSDPETRIENMIGVFYRYREVLLPEYDSLDQSALRNEYFKFLIYSVLNYVSDENTSTEDTCVLVDKLNKATVRKDAEYRDFNAIYLEYLSENNIQADEKFNLDIARKALSEVSKDISLLDKLVSDSSLLRVYKYLREGDHLKSLTEKHGHYMGVDGDTTGRIKAVTRLLSVVEDDDSESHKPHLWDFVNSLKWRAALTFDKLSDLVLFKGQDGSRLLPKGRYVVPREEEHQDQPTDDDVDALTYALAITRAPKLLLQDRLHAAAVYCTYINEHCHDVSGDEVPELLGALDSVLKHQVRAQGWFGQRAEEAVNYLLDDHAAQARENEEIINLRKSIGKASEFNPEPVQLEDREITRLNAILDRLGESEERDRYNPLLRGKMSDRDFAKNLSHHKILLNINRYFKALTDNVRDIKPCRNGLNEHASLDQIRMILDEGGLEPAVRQPYILGVEEEEQPNGPQQQDLDIDHADADNHGFE